MTSSQSWTVGDLNASDVSDLLTEVARLVEATRDMDYDPSQEGWICGEHGIAECGQGACPGLPWPKPNASPLLSAFMAWADGEFRRVVRPYDESDDPDREMPEEAFRAYALWEWPLGSFLEQDISD